MASNAITSWQIEGENVVTVTNFIFLSSKITVDGDYSHEIKNKTKQAKKKKKPTCLLEEKIWQT